MAAASNPVLTIPVGMTLSAAVIKKAEKFLTTFRTHELDNNVLPLLHLDQKSEAYYVLCHLRSSVIASKTDSDAVLDPDEGEEYKFNRDIYTDSFAYRVMARDAAAAGVSRIL